MAQTKKKRKTKHRGDQAGRVESRGRTSRPKTRAQARQQAMQNSNNRKVDRATRPPSWRGATIRASFAAGIFLVLLLLLMKQPPVSAVFISILMLGIYIPAGYYTDVFLYNRRMKKEAEERLRKAAEKEAKKSAKKSKQPDEPQDDEK